MIAQALTTAVRPLGTLLSIRIAEARKVRKDLLGSHGNWSSTLACHCTFPKPSIVFCMTLVYS